MAEQVLLAPSMDGRASKRRNMNHFKLRDGPDILTPKNMLELPRPGAAVANEAGDLAYVVVSQFSFAKKKSEKSVHVLSLTGSAHTSIEGSSVFWIDSHTLVKVTEDDGVQTLEALDVATKGKHVTVTHAGTIGSLPKGISADNFQFTKKGHLLVFSALVYPDYDLETVAKQDEEYEARGTTAYVFDDTFVRHWDTWRGPKKSRLFGVTLSKEKETWRLGKNFYRPLLESEHYTPVEPFGGSDDFSINATHIVYTTKDPSLPEALHTRQNVYIVPIKGGEKPRRLTSSKQGATHSPAFSPDGSKVVWLEMAKDGYESDHAVITIYDLKKDVRFTVASKWDRSPDAISFSHDGASLVFTAGDLGHIKVFTVPLPSTPLVSDEAVEDDAIPVALTELHAANGAQSLPGGRILYTSNSLTSPNNAYLVSNLDHPESPLEIQRLTSFGDEALEGKNLDPGEEFWFTGAENIRVHGFAIKPKGWEAGKTKKYPAVLLIHGGPQGAWEDSWSTRWNPNVFAQQGYFTIFINPTGSTTYGQNFTDAITEDWGGRPFQDLIAGWKYVLDRYPEINPKRTAAAGASYGGFAINWIQSHPEFGFGFKALVCHDGVFDTHYNGYSTDELFFFNHDFGGPPWITKATEKFNPSRLVPKWSTPELIIHSGKDYRLPETEGIAAFHALQQRGIPSRFLYFPDENHWVLKPENSLKWHYEVFKWIAEFVGEDD
ncbi:Dipeptidyl-peptidase 5; AltName: Full=Dipeptidyl-peptidase V; Short=DPP V; Short=DppV; Flags: Precursor [Serendipita indica DSM 11827]|uniref:Dipeptidyl-peptidase V n=1 Tax=Serendipita indica (strain DSM 11827) TaxID=1109443 RepID=G4TI57_SERID|nr:Dipeptidyl-peptidase 5; AltName: Full=Dipeptidyl-peptidase V; Short=DPP V; Short=DppV; Flags: Precursor [Serendipita indica DSM 11827]CCA71006.1 related to secreted dipeptidyl-peptidase V precursor [Serendipita indica DSM 11827]